jgi:hypothetical protein
MNNINKEYWEKMITSSPKAMVAFNTWFDGYKYSLDGKQTLFKNGYPEACIEFINIDMDFQISLISRFILEFKNSQSRVNEALKSIKREFDLIEKELKS